MVPIKMAAVPELAGAVEKIAEESGKAVEEIQPNDQ